MPVPSIVTENTSFDTVIIGGGAAGLMCAMAAGQRGKKVLLIEHANRCGKKILMSGGGRCNFTNTGATPANYLSNNVHFCKSALARYTPQHFIDMVERHGIAYHEKELGQLFCDESSKQIVKMLLDECEWADVKINTSCSVDRIEKKPDSFLLQTSQGVVETRKCVIASGGLSIPSMGASGFGYEIAKQFGHKVLPTRAGLVPLTLTGKPQEQLADLSGLSVPVEVTFGKTSFKNAMLITHRGLSGPAILQISSYWQPGQALHANLLPDVNAEEFLQTQLEKHPAAELKNCLADVLPKRLAQRLCETEFDNKPMKQHNQKQLKSIAEVLNHWPIIASGTEGYRTAEVTLGGVDTQELSSSTMESKLITGLYFIGEVVDVTGHLGGYNFQWAWASGNACGCAL
jgi:predicted Rossmann fold flavoprotein